jgi:hypothetical protein
MAMQLALPALACTIGAKIPGRNPIMLRHSHKATAPLGTLVRDNAGVGANGPSVGRGPMDDRERGCTVFPER